jgi:puromycin-sensitive aminopeptidase
VACTFTGTVAVQLKLTEPSTTITLHAHQLLINDDITFTGPDGVVVRAATVLFNFAAQTVTLSFGSELLGDGQLHLSFQGTLNDSLAGFYRSQFMLRGEKRTMALTQFEATDARRCFPCIDEPAAKAVFALTVVAPADRTVLSNTQAVCISTSDDGASKTWCFADTPVMSTYLVAVVVGDFDVVSKLHGGVTTSVYTPPGKSHLARFALDFGVEALAYLESLFGIRYLGGAKVDHVACQDFAAGAMENTGLITYREAALLINERESSLATKQRVAQVVAHELSHQWFGNLVTMKWWNGLWLNEGMGSRQRVYSVAL